VAHILWKQGIAEAYVFQGRLDAWQAAGNPGMPK
jgi:hypothetical protein